ncbi:MAG: hypothetical protein M1837_002154 [Sclerophora amabilis]|nr:MAG: hypothetical protein M1837_002154 [Sclerophora amabilis]
MEDCNQAKNLCDEVGVSPYSIQISSRTRSSSPGTPDPSPSSKNHTLQHAIGRPSADSLLYVFFRSRSSPSYAPRPARIPIAASRVHVENVYKKTSRSQDIDDEKLFQAVVEEYNKRRGWWRRVVSLRKFRSVRVISGMEGGWEEGTLIGLMARPARGRGKQEVVDWVRGERSSVSSTLPSWRVDVDAATKPGRPALEISEGWRTGRIVLIWLSIISLSIVAGTLWIFFGDEGGSERSAGYRGVGARVRTGVIIMQAGLCLGGLTAAGWALLSWLVE